MKANTLKAGDKAALISPSGSIKKFRKNYLQKAINNFQEQLGVELVLAPNAMAYDYYSAGTPKQRADDFNWAIKNPEIKAVVFSMGGGTAIDIVDMIDYELIKAQPKLITGISDASTLLNAIQAKTGLVTFLGVEFNNYAENDMTFEIQKLKKAWYKGNYDDIRPNPNWQEFSGTPTRYDGWRTIRKGAATGKLIGGTFECYSQLFHTEYMPDVTGNLLIAEFYKNSKRDIYQRLKRLRLWGVLDKIGGLIIGYNIGSDNPLRSHDKKDIAELTLEATEGYEFPIMQIGEIGHQIANVPLPIGASAELNATEQTFKILETVAKIEDTVTRAQGNSSLKLNLREFARHLVNIRGDYIP